MTTCLHVPLRPACMPPTCTNALRCLACRLCCRSLQDGRPTGGMLGMLSQAQSALLARLSPPPPPPAAAAAIDVPAGAASGQPPQQPPWLFLARLTAGRALQWLAGAAALAGGVWWGASATNRGEGNGWASLWPLAAAQEGVTPEAAEVAKDTGLPVHALRRAQAAAAQQWQRQQQEEAEARRQQQDVQQAAAPREQRQAQSKPVAAISQKAAHKLVQQWLVSQAGDGWCRYISGLLAPACFSAFACPRRRRLQRGMSQGHVVPVALPSSQACTFDEPCLALPSSQLSLRPHPIPLRPQRAKAEAMGPKHRVDQLHKVGVVCEKGDVGRTGRGRAAGNAASRSRAPNAVRFLGGLGSVSAGPSACSAHCGICLPFYLPVASRAPHGGGGLKASAVAAASSLRRCRAVCSHAAPLLLLC